MPRSAGSSSFTTSPSNSISPAVMSSSPAIRRSTVDLPQPEGPTKTTNSLSAISRLIPLITFAEPKDLWTSRMVIAATVDLPERSRAERRRKRYAFHDRHATRREDHDRRGRDRKTGPRWLRRRLAKRRAALRERAILSCSVTSTC
jgi:hypothetical protein